MAPNVPLDASALPRYTQRRPGAAGGREPAGRARRQGRRRARRVERGGVRHPPAAASATSAPCGRAATCSARAASSASQRHRGVEGSLAWRGGAWGVRAGAQWLHARVEDAGDPTLDGKQPTNVPAVTARAAGATGSVAGTRRACACSPPARYESAREVLPDNSVRIPSVTKFDLGARYETKSGAGTTWTLRAGVDNVFDRRAWRESALPVQPRLPVPARAAHAARLAAGRPLSRPRREGRRYNLRLFLDSSVGRAPDC